MTSPKPLFVRWIKLTIEDANNVEHTFQCYVTQAGLTSTGGDAVSLSTLCPEGSFSENTERTWQLTATGVQDLETAESFQLFLLEHEGESASFVYYPKTDKNGNPVGRGFTGDVTIAPPDNIGNAASGTYATFTVTLPMQGKYKMVDEAGNPIPNKAAVKPGDVFTDSNITASDASNAAELTTLGYVADPAEVPWALNEKFTVSTFGFHWDETANAGAGAWASGAHTLAATKGSSRTAAATVQ
jgi:hypothetical protein